MSWGTNRLPRRLLILSIAPILLLGAVLIAGLALQLRDERTSHRSKVLDQTATQIENQVKSWGELVRGVTLAADLNQGDSEKIDRLFRGLLARFSDISSIQFIAPDGQRMVEQRRTGVVSLPTVSLTSSGLREHVQRVGLWVAPLHIQNEGSARLPLVAVLQTEERARGFLIVEFETTSIQTAVARAGVPLVLTQNPAERNRATLRPLEGLGLFIALDEKSNTGTVLWVVLGLSLSLLVFVALAGILQRRWLQRAAADIAHRERLMTIGATASAIGHELRTALAVIRNSIDSLKIRMDLSDPRTVKHTDAIESQVRMGNRLLSDLLEFARPRSAFLTNGNINPLIDEVAGSLNLPRAIRIETILDDRLPSVSLDADKMRQVLSNLILNAADAMPNGGSLKISTQLRSEYVVVELRDSGVGMSLDVRQRLFEPFFSTKARGMGLGLSIVKKIVDDHSGDICVESIPSQGTVIVFRLPVPALKSQSMPTSEMAQTT